VAVGSFCMGCEAVRLGVGSYTSNIKNCIKQPVLLYGPGGTAAAVELGESKWNTAVSLARCLKRTPKSERDHTCFGGRCRRACCAAALPERGLLLVVVGLLLQPCGVGMSPIFPLYNPYLV
jgi:hypothetical protein